MTYPNELTDARSGLSEPAEAGPRWPQPGELWSLWDMLQRIDLNFFVSMGEILNVADAIYEYDPYLPSTKSQEESVADLFNSMATACKMFGLDTYEPTYRKLATDLPQANETYFFARDQFQALMKKRFLLHMPSSADEVYQRSDLFGKEVTDAFPTSAREIRDAGNCIAVGQPTAAIFHMMRAMEVPLQCLSTEFGKGEIKNWNAALNDIEAAVRDRDNASKRPQWDQEKDYFTDMVTTYFLVKEAWRNYTAHLKARYNDEEAREIMVYVKGFMRKAAKRLKE